MRYIVRFIKEDNLWEVFDDIAKVSWGIYEKKHIAFNVCNRMNSDVIAGKK